MPRGQVGGATEELIAAVSAAGVKVSAYQIERWRQAGALPRVARQGLGRGRGTRSHKPDEATVQKAIVLARGSRQGSPRAGGHIIERFALGLPLADDKVRAAFMAQLDAVAQMTAADVQGDDAGWQARHDAAYKAARSPHSLTPVRWSDLVDAVDGKEMAAPPDAARRRAALAGAIHAIGGNDEALAGDLTEMIGIAAGLSEEELEWARRAQQEAELRGDDLWSRLVQALSLENLRRLVRETPISDLRRASSATLTIGLAQSVATLVGLADLAGAGMELPAPINRFNGQMIRRMQADPMWASTGAGQINFRPRQRIRHLALTALGMLLVPGQLEEAVRYESYLCELTGWKMLHPRS